jgi:hypothetical protein
VLTNCKKTFKFRHYNYNYKKFLQKKLLQNNGRRFLIFQQFVLPLQIIMQQQKRTQNEKNHTNNHRAPDDTIIIVGAKKGQKQKRSATASCRAADKAKQ